MKTIDILVGINRADDRMGVDMSGQRELDQYAIDVGFIIQATDQGEQKFLRCMRWQAVFETGNARLGTGAPFCTDINAARGIITDQDDRKTGLPRQLCNISRNSTAHCGGERFAVDDRRRHAVKPLKACSAG